MTAVILVSSWRHLPHHVHEVHLVFLVKTKQGMRIRVKKNSPIILALALFTMLRQDRNLKPEKFILLKLISLLTFYNLTYTIEWVFKIVFLNPWHKMIFEVF